MVPGVEGPGEVLGAVPGDGLADGVPGNVVVEMSKERMLRGVGARLLVKRLSNDRRPPQISHHISTSQAVGCGGGLVTAFGHSPFLEKNL